MSNVVRKDVIQLSFENDLSGLTQAQGELDKLKASVTGDLDSGLTKATEGFDELTESVEGLGKSAKKTEKPLDDVGKTNVNPLISGLKKVGNHLTTIADKASKAAFTGLKKIAGISFKVLAAGVGAVGAALAASVKSFADYEQLVGGVDTLFKDSSGTVQKNAANAWKTAGLSANEYMENVTGFSASLIASCGEDTAEAAKLADVAIKDMSDNANKMGTPMENLVNAYQGFAKQNYTLLDNLKLGYGGTKEEMARLIKEASAMKDIQEELGVSVDATDMSFGNIVKAINVVQKKMGIYNATADEAEGTVTGSLNAMKASWKNLITAIGSGENMDEAFENMISSAEIFLGNLMPVAERALGGLGTMIEKLAPVVAEKLPTIIRDFLPSLVSAAGTLISALARELPAIIKELIPVLVEAAAEVVRALYEAFTGKEMSDGTFEGIKSTLNGLVSTIKTALPVILVLLAAFKGYSIVKKVAGGISTFAKGLRTIADKTTGGLGKKVKDVGDGVKTTGTSAKNSSKGLFESAKAFLMMAAAVLLIAVSFGILAFSAIALANAGWGAIAVMLGMVLALVALGYGMMVLLQSLSTLGPNATKGALAMILLGAAIILVAAGFAILTYCAISLSSAGGAAIGVFFGMVAAIAVLVVIVGLFGGALIAGAVGFVIFAAGLLLCATAALIFAIAVQKMTPPLLALIPVVGMVVTMVVNAVGTVLVNCIQAAGQAISQILQSIGEIFLNFGEGVKLIIEGIGNAISSVLDSVAGIFDSIGNAAANAGLGFERVAKGLKLISELSLGDLIKSVGAVAKALSEVAENGEGLALAGQGMQSLITAFISIATTGTIAIGVLLRFTEAIGGIQSAFNAVNLQSAGVQMLNGLIVGMNSKRAAAISTARSIAQAINREYRKVQDINSPSGEWESYGAYQIQGDINGMKKGLPKLESTVAEVGETSLPYYSPESSSNTYYSRSNDSEYNTYAPQFNLTIGGTGDDRAMARKVKRWISEAMDEAFDSLARNNKRVQEI